MTKNELRNLKRRQRSAELRAAGYTSTEIRRYRDFGVPRYTELIKTPRKPKKKLTESQKRVSEQYYKLKSKGFTTEESNQLKSLPQNKFNRLMVILQYNFTTTTIDRKLDEYKFTKKQKRAIIQPFSIQDKGLSRFDKRKLWGNYVKNDKFPKQVLQNVRKANKLYGLAADDGYGYGLAFYMWMDDLSFWEAIQIYQPDETNPDKYIFANVMPR